MSGNRFKGVDWIYMAQDLNWWTGSCEHGNEYSGSIKCRELFDQLNDYRLIKKNAALWN
jgi:hypothetical protein